MAFTGARSDSPGRAPLPLLKSHFCSPESHDSPRTPKNTPSPEANRGVRTVWPLVRSPPAPRDGIGCLGAAESPAHAPLRRLRFHLG